MSDDLRLWRCPECNYLYYLTDDTPADARVCPECETEMCPSASAPEVALYTILVEFTHTTCCHSHDLSAALRVYGKSVEQARYRAKELARQFPGVREVHGTRLLAIGGPDYGEEPPTDETKTWYCPHCQSDLTNEWMQAEVNWNANGKVTSQSLDCPACGKNMLEHADA